MSARPASRRLLPMLLHAIPATLAAELRAVPLGCRVLWYWRGVPVLAGWA